MGWVGYGIYDGDETQILHLDYLKWSGCIIGMKEDEVWEWLKQNKTKIPLDKIALFKKGIPLILKKMSKWRIRGSLQDEDLSIEWQMLLALFLDNNIKLPLIVKKNGILATEYLLGDHAEDFSNKGIRRRVLKNFIKRAKL